MYNCADQMIYTTTATGSLVASYESSSGSDLNGALHRKCKKLTKRRHGWIKRGVEQSVVEVAGFYCIGFSQKYRLTH